MIVDVYLEAPSAPALAADLAGFAWLVWGPSDGPRQGRDGDDPDRSCWALDPIGLLPVEPRVAGGDGRPEMLPGWHANLRLVGAVALDRAAALWLAQEAGFAAGSQMIGAETVVDGVRTTLHGAPPATPRRSFA